MSKMNKVQTFQEVPNEQEISTRHASNDSFRVSRMRSCANSYPLSHLHSYPADTHLHSCPADTDANSTHPNANDR